MNNYDKRVLLNILKLKDVPHNDKTWIFKNLVKDEFIWEVFAIDCALESLSYPNDGRAERCHISSNDAISRTSLIEKARCAEFAACFLIEIVKNNANKLKKEQKRQLNTLIYLLESSLEV